MKKADNNTQKKMTIDKENFQTILDKLHHQDLRNCTNYSGNLLRKMNLYTIYSGTA